MAITLQDALDRVRNEIPKARIGFNYAIPYNNGYIICFSFKSAGLGAMNAKHLWFVNNRTIDKISPLRLLSDSDLSETIHNSKNRIRL